MKQQIERDSAAQHLGQIAGPDGHFAHQPVRPARPRRIPVAAALRQVFAGDHAEARGDHLHENRDQAGQADHPQQAVFELSAALKVRAPVAWVHVADAHENGRAYESAPLLPESGLMVRNLDGVVDALKRDVAGRCDRDGLCAWGAFRRVSAVNSASLALCGPVCLHLIVPEAPESTGVHNRALTVVNHTEREGKREIQILSAAERPSTTAPAAVLMENVLS